MTYPVIRDISYCQNGFNGKGLKARKVALMIRMGQGIWKDEDFDANYSMAMADGVAFGVWWFYQPNMPFAPQVAAFLAIYNSLPWKPPVIALDVENITYWTDEQEDGSKIVDANGQPIEILINIFPPSPATHTAWLLGWCRAIQAATGNRPGIYTRQDYWNAWTLRGSGLGDFWLWVASWTSYSVNIAMPADWDTWVIWQDEGGTATDPDIPGPVDHDFYNGTTEQMLAFFGIATEVKMGKSYKTDPATCERAITINSADARATVAPKDLGVGLLIIRAGGSTGPNFSVFEDSAWDQRQKAANADGVRVALLFELDPAWYRANNVDEGMVKDRSGDPSRQPVLLQFLRCLHTNPAATWEMMQASKPGDWRPVQAVMFSQFNNLYKGADVGEVWFSLPITDIVNQVKVLMNNGKIPSLPIALQIAPEMLAKYQQQLAMWLAYKPATANDAPARNSWLRLALAGKSVWTLYEGHSDIPDLATCWPWTWANINADGVIRSLDGTVAYIPEGYEVVLHEVTDKRMYTPTYKDSAGNNQPVDLSLAPVPLESWLGTQKPSENPNPDLAALTAKMAALEVRVAYLEKHAPVIHATLAIAADPPIGPG